MGDGRASSSRSWCLIEGVREYDGLWVMAGQVVIGHEGVTVTLI